MRTVAGILLMIVAGAPAQTQDPSPQFEVASIKPSPPDVSYSMRVAGGPGTKDPSLFTCENLALSNLVTLAYSLNSDQVLGPAWMDSTRFNVSAKVPEGATWQQFQQMLQNLLAERFKLKFHYEKKEMPQQVLVVAKNGAKLKPSAPAPPPTDDNPNPESRKSMSMSAEDGQTITRATETSMTQLAAQLSGELHQRVTDGTGLPGHYDFTMKWVQGTSAEEGGSPIFEALQKQLGLKLEQKKIMVEIMVVDRIEKTPTEN